MNKISDKKVDAAVDLFCEGASIREVAKIVAIAKETAHRIRKYLNEYEIEETGKGLKVYGNGCINHGKIARLKPVFKKANYVRQ